MPKSGKRNKIKKGKKTYRILGLILIITAAIIWIIIPRLTEKKSTGKSVKENLAVFEFIKNGELTFTNKDGEYITKVDIEIAEDNNARATGLMYRYKLGMNQGMFFIFPYQEPQSFWMKNTPLSLDMIFINKNNEIVKIHSNTTPFSKQSYSSLKPAVYVLELNAGYTSKYSIIEGDKIVWRRN